MILTKIQPNEGKEHLNIHTCRWCTGKIDYSAGAFVETTRGIVDYGFDMYAPQTFAGKNVAMGWLNMWDRNVPSAKYGFAGMLTVPRSMSMTNGRLYQEPVVNCSEVFTASISDKHVDNIVTGVVTVKAIDLEGFELKLRSNGENYTSLTLADGEWVFDRSKSGESIVGAEKDQDSINGIRRMPCSCNREITLTIVMDEFSVEIFECGRALSSTIYPPCGADGLELKVKASACQYTKSKINK